MNNALWENPESEKKKIWQIEWNVCRLLRPGFDKGDVLCQFLSLVNSTKSNWVSKISLKARWKEMEPLVISKHVFPIWGMCG